MVTDQILGDRIKQLSPISFYNLAQSSPFSFPFNQMKQPQTAECRDNTYTSTEEYILREAIDSARISRESVNAEEEEPDTVQDEDKE